MTIKLESKPFLLAALATALLPGVAAAESEYELRLGASHNDNITRSSSQELDDTVAAVGFLLDSDYESSRITGKLVSDLEYWHYIDDTFDNEVVGSLAADLTVELVPGVVDWIIEDNFGDIQIDPFQPVTGGNRERLNSFSTGPDLRLKLGSATAAELSARYSTRNYEITDSDSEVVGGYFAFVRALSPKRSISLNFSENQVEYDNPLANTDFDKQSVYLSFNSIVARGSVDIYAGWSEVDRNGVKSDSPLWGVDLSRKLTARTTLEFGVSQQFSDAASGFRAFQSIAAATGSTVPTTGLADPYENRNLYIGIRSEARRNTIGFSAMLNDEDYLTSNVFDRRTQQAIFTIDRELGASWEVGLIVSFERAEFEALDREDDDIGYGLSLSKKLSRRLTLKLSYGHTSRDSTLAGAEYDENVASLFISYRR